MEGKLIEAVRVRKLLYDTEHDDYSKPQLKCDAWKEVAKDAGIRNGNEAKIMWEKLRHSLRDALRRQQKCRKSGVPAKSMKMWRFQKQMEFLHPYMAIIAREGNSNDESETSEVADLSDVVKMSEWSVRGVRRSGKPEASLTAPAKRMKRNILSESMTRSIDEGEDETKFRSEERKKMAPEASVFSKQTIADHMDPLYHFFMSMYKVTKEMPLSSQFQVRNDIFRVVSDMEGKLLNIATTSPLLITVDTPPPLDNDDDDE